MHHRHAISWRRACACRGLGVGVRLGAGLGVRARVRVRVCVWDRVRRTGGRFEVEHVGDVVPRKLVDVRAGRVDLVPVVQCSP